jgi:bacillithiol system protein YtxJ
MNWNHLTSTQDILDIEERSRTVPCLILKHSTTCPISSIAKMRLESSWDFSAEELEVYHLDLLRHRDISRFIAEHFAVHHESPQVLLIRDGMCTYDNSHLDINVAEIHECYAAK